jgi:hypothetical protein
VSVADTCNNLATVELKLGNLQKALEPYEKSLEITMKCEYASMVDTYSN